MLDVSTCDVTLCAVVGRWDCVVDDVVDFCAGVCADESTAAVVKFCAMVDTADVTGTDVAACDTLCAGTCDVTLCAVVGCWDCVVDDVVGFCADICAEDSAVVDTIGKDMLAFDTLCGATCDVTLCAVFVGHCGCVVSKTDDVSGFCAMMDTYIELGTAFDAAVPDD